jgi:putative component of toxin-antitoxin plasmid stabilization module
VPANEPWEVELYEDEAGTEPVRDWMEDLSGAARAAAIAAIEEILTPRGTQVCDTEWGKNLREGIYELRIRHTAGEITRMFGDDDEAEDDEEQEWQAAQDEDRGDRNAKVLLRIYFATDGRRIILLLAGYDKGRFGGGKREQKTIATARRRLADHRERQKRHKSRSRKRR